MGFSIRIRVASDFDSEPVLLLGFMGISFIEIKILSKLFPFTGAFLQFRCFKTFEKSILDQLNVK